MAGLRQIEDFVENAFIATLTANSDISTKAKHWKDASSSKTFPVVAVHCSTAINEPWTAGTISDWFQCFVEIGVITYNPSDKSRATAKSLFGSVRDVLSSSSILSTLSSKDNVAFLAVIPTQSANEVDDGDYNQYSLTLECHVQYRILPST